MIWATISSTISNDMGNYRQWLLTIGVREDDERTLAAELQRHPLQIALRRGGHDKTANLK